MGGIVLASPHFMYLCRTELLSLSTIDVFIVGSCPVHCRLSAVSLASIYPMPVPPSPPVCDNHPCLQALPNGP